MKKQLCPLWILAIMMLTAGQVWAQEKNAESFEDIKALEGEWEGVNPEGTPVVVTYKVISGGSAVMETLQPKGEPSMITMYHMDDDKLMMTHYCSAGNQPRMKAKDLGSDRKIDFVFADGTNLETRSGGHMQALTFTFKDENHIEQVWTFRQGGEDKAGTFKLSRKS